MWPNPQFPADLDHLLKKILMENFIFLAVKSLYKSTRKTHQKLKKWFGR